MPPNHSIHTALLLACVAVSASPAAARKQLGGDPAKSGIVVLDCSVRIVKLGPSPQLVHALLGQRSLDSSEVILARPLLIRTDDPRRKFGPHKDGDLFFFPSLEPGTYSLAEVFAVANSAELPGQGESNEPRSLEYPLRTGPAELSAIRVDAGTVLYLGNLAVFDSRFHERDDQEAPPPAVNFLLLRRGVDAIAAVQRLQRIASGTPWESRLRTESLAAQAASDRDTALQWTW